MCECGYTWCTRFSRNSQKSLELLEFPEILRSSCVCAGTCEVPDFLEILKSLLRMSLATQLSVWNCLLDVLSAMTRMYARVYSTCCMQWQCTVRQIESIYCVHWQSTQFTVGNDSLLNLLCAMTISVCDLNLLYAIQSTLNWLYAMTEPTHWLMLLLLLRKKSSSSFAGSSMYSNVQFVTHTYTVRDS